eukprot:350594-Chlamydomonas_euryale.AAC.3
MANTPDCSTATRYSRPMSADSRQHTPSVAGTPQCVARKHVDPQSDAERDGTERVGDRLERDKDEGHGPRRAARDEVAGEGEAELGEAEHSGGRPHGDAEAGREAKARCGRLVERDQAKQVARDDGQEECGAPRADRRLVGVRVHDRGQHAAVDGRGGLVKRRLAAPEAPDASQQRRGQRAGLHLRNCVCMCGGMVRAGGEGGGALCDCAHMCGQWHAGMTLMDQHSMHVCICGFTNLPCHPSNCSLACCPGRVQRTHAWLEAAERLHGPAGWPPASTLLMLLHTLLLTVSNPLACSKSQESPPTSRHGHCLLCCPRQAGAWEGAILPRRQKAASAATSQAQRHLRVARHNCSNSQGCRCSSLMS